MDRQHRHDLKHDKFVDEVGAWSVRARENQRLLLMIAGGILAVALIAYGIFFYRNNKEQKAQGLLATAIETIDSPLLPAPGGQPAPNAKFKTDEERSAAAEKQFRDVVAKYDGTDAAEVAGLYLARIDAGKGDVKAARVFLEKFVKSHSGTLLANSARYSLYQLRIENGEAQQVVTELNAEMTKAEPALPTDSILALIAQAYEVQGDATRSKETYRRLITEFPESPYALDAQRRAGPA